MESCSYCNPGSYGEYVLSSAPWTRLKLFNNGGDVTISAHGDNECYYEPKFCPECGRKLIRISELFWYEEGWYY